MHSALRSNMDVALEKYSTESVQAKINLEL
jgi:hypothetical protein